MTGRWLQHITVAIFLATVFSLNANAQFKKEAFSQNYEDDTTPKDSVDKVFSVKEYWAGIRHKKEIKVSTMLMGSSVLVGGCQIYNKDYWKLPIVYGGIAAGVGTGLYFGSRYSSSALPSDKLARNLGYGTAALCYWGALMDGVVSYDDPFPSPSKAAMYSLLCPGLGQIYNGEFWKIPVYVGGLAGCVNYYFLNRTNYERFRRIYKEATETSNEVPISAETALYYRNVYRRYRDYSVVAFAAVYLLQVIDANVFAAMHDFEVSDDLTMNLSPAVIKNDCSLAMGGQALGLRLGFTF